MPSPAAACSSPGSGTPYGDDALGGPPGVTSAAVEVAGCVAEDGQAVSLILVRADDEFVVVPWSDLLWVGRRVGGDVPSSLRAELTEVTRWFGHTVEITTLDGRRLVGTVTGFELDQEQIDVLIAPLDHPRHPMVNEYAVPLDQLDTVVDWGP
jgi:hypothetical protein